MFGSKVLGVTALSLALAASAFGRVGPVSQYGQLQAGKNSSGKGQIYGACKGVTSGNEVQVQGMSLFWSISSDVGSPFWTADYVKGLVDKQNIQIIRAPMGVDEDWGSGNYFTNKGYYQGLMNTVVQAAIDNDIYVIIDYHSHKASDNVNNAKDFFGYMAQKWGKYDNVIFEVFNEPISQSWGTIKTYADQVISEIRKYSDNLIVVGNRSWDQYPNEAISAPISDKNVAYTFHYYAGSHSTGNEGANAVQAMNAGLSVFVTEWGTVNADGDGGVSGSNSGWLSWMNQHKLSGANWAVSNKSEGASYFNGSAWNYSNSGQWVNTNIFSKLPKSYSACSAGGNTPASSSSVASSSSSLPAGYTDYIDDFEDGDSLAFTGGIWYAYTDKDDLGGSSITNTSNKDAKGNSDYDVVVNGDNNTKGMGAITGIKLVQGQNKYEPYVALGIKLNADETAYDLSACKTISYKYKGAGHNFKVEDTAVKDYAFHQISKTSSTSWTQANVPWDMLNQPSWTSDPVTLSQKRITKFTWEVKGDLKGSQPSPNYLYIDDVRCNGLAIKPVVAKPASSSSSAPKSSSSSVKSSSSSTPSSSSRTPIVTSVALTSNNATQSVTAGNAIKNITYTVTNGTSAKVEGLPQGLQGVLSSDKKTFTISGTVDASLATKDYAFTVTVTGVDNNSTATGVIKVTRAPIVTSVALTSNNATQSVTAGNAIKNITYTVTNGTSAKVEGLPQGLQGVLSSDKKTFTISGTVDASLATKDYAFTVTVTGVDNSSTATGVIKVTRAPIVTSVALTSNNATQSVTAGNAIKNITYTVTNGTSAKVEGLPQGLQGVLSSDKKTFTISGTVDASLATKDYAFTVTVTGVDNSSTATGVIKVTEVPRSSSSVKSSSSVAPSSSSETPIVSSSSEALAESSSSSSEVQSSSSEISSSSVATYVVTGSLEQSVVRGGTIETVVITGVNTYSRESWNINFLTFPQNVADDNTITISGVLLSWGPEGDYTETLKVNGEKIYFTLHVLPKPVSSSSVESSSSVVSSSSSEILTESSSSDIPDTDLELSSSSVVSQALAVNMAGAFKMNFANNQLTLSNLRTSDVSVQVFDMMGNMVMSQQVATSGNAVVPMNNMRQGNYMVRVIDGSAAQVARISIK